MAGGFEANAERNRQFFSTHQIRPSPHALAIDLGAGCGFQSVPLAEAGFRVTAVDFCQPLLDELCVLTPAAGIETITGDMMDFPLWAGRRPELIVCMGDTLTHLPDISSVRGLVRQCHAELVPGGRLVLSFRDYSLEADDPVAIIPVRRDADRIFLCRLEYHPETVVVTDILFDQRSGKWERTAGTYTETPARSVARPGDAGRGGIPNRSRGYGEWDDCFHRGKTLSPEGLFEAGIKYSSGEPTPPNPPSIRRTFQVLLMSHL